MPKPIAGMGFPQLVKKPAMVYSLELELGPTFHIANEKESLTKWNSDDKKPEMAMDRQPTPAAWPSSMPPAIW